MKRVKITFQDYHYKCGDGCCDEYGKITKVNDIEVSAIDDIDVIVKGILTQLGYEVEIIGLDENGEESYTI